MLSDNKIKDLWNQIIDYIQSNEIFDTSTFSTYIQTASLYSVNDTFAIIQVPYSTSKSFFIAYKDVFEDIFKHFLDKKIECKVVNEKDLVDEFTIKNNSFNLLNEAREKNKIREDYTFDNFIEGKSNMTALNACLACINAPEQTGLNPLFIYGNSGLGKTHLLHAMCNELDKNHPDINYLYIDGNYLIEMIIKSLTKKQSNALTEQMCQLDYLMIDDIQHLARTKDTQELFFNIFNRLIDNNKKVILTSDLYPTELGKINNRIISRFTSGLSVGIDEPEFETAVSILYKKLEGRDEENIISKEALYYIAHRYSHDVRTLEGALNRLIFQSIMYNPTIIDEEFAQFCFKDDPNSSTSTEITVDRIKKEVCSYYNITKKQIESKSRTKGIANPRHIAIYLCRELLDLPFSKIGEEFGKRDHSTVMTSCEKISKLIKTDSSFDKAVKQIKENLSVD